MWQKSISTYNPNENGDLQIVNGIEQAVGANYLVINVTGEIAPDLSGHTFAVDGTTYAEVLSALDHNRPVQAYLVDMGYHVPVYLGIETATAQEAIFVYFPTLAFEGMLVTPFISFMKESDPEVSLLYVAGTIIPRTEDNP